MFLNSYTIFCFLLFFLIFTVVFNSPSDSIPFTTSSNKNFTLFGDAHFRNSSISLTQQNRCDSTISSSSGIGRAFYVYPIRFLDFSNNTTASFSSTFSFTISPASPYCPFGDEIAFLITSDVGPVSFSDGYMGLPESNSFLAVEFDTSFDPNLGDSNGNHVGVDFNSVISLVSVDSLSKGVDLTSGRKITAWIEYSNMEKMIQVWAGYSELMSPLSPLLISRFDISKNFKEFMHVGFSASNGRGSAIHPVDEWQFGTGSSLVTTTIHSLDELWKCFLCPNNTDGKAPWSSHHQGIRKLLVLALGLGAIVLFLVFVGVLCIKKMNRVRKESLEVQSGRLNKVP